MRERLPVSVAQAAQAHLHLWPFRRRASRRLHAGAGLEGVCVRRARRSGAGRLCDFRRVRSGAACARSSINADLRLDADEGTAVSPLYWKLPRRPQARCGGRRRRIRASSCGRAAPSREGWRSRGVETRYEEIAGANHFTVIDPLSDPASAMTRRVVELAHVHRARCALEPRRTPECPSARGRGSARGCRACPRRC